MNRREFIRSAIATVTIMAVGVTGMFEIATKAASNQASQQQLAQQVQLPPVGSETSQSSSSSQASQEGSTSAAQVSSASQASAQVSSASAPSGYVLVAALSSLSGKTSAYFTHPTHGNSILLDLSGQWRAFSATCTHRVCTVEYVSSEIYCPCHGATFSATNGSVTRGPAQVALGEYGVIVQNGEVYVTSSVIN
jgi:cytochrome b6-f complex iron-sulfur subunit